MIGEGLAVAERRIEPEDAEPVVVAGVVSAGVVAAAALDASTGSLPVAICTAMPPEIAANAPAVRPATRRRMVRACRRRAASLRVAASRRAGSGGGAEEAVVSVMASTVSTASRKPIMTA